MKLRGIHLICIGAAVDMVGTAWGLHHGGVEANPVAVLALSIAGLAGLVVLKVLGVAATAWFLGKVEGDYPRFTLALCAVLATLTALAGMGVLGQALR